MMLTIHGLPTSVTYKDLKRLVKQECHITDFILDNLVTDDDGCKKVRIGVTDESDGSQLMKFLNGYHFSGNVLRVVPVGKQAQQNQNNFDTRGGYQPRNDFHVQPNNFDNLPMGHSQPPRPNAWAPNATWGQPAPMHVQQNAFGHHPQPTPVNNAYVHPEQQARSNFPPGRVSMPQPPHQQNFGFMPKNVPGHPVPNQYEHQPSMVQGQFHGPPHAQPSSWNTQMQPVKQPFEKPTPGFNQTAFNDHRQMPKQSPAHDSRYKDYDKGRFEPQSRGQSPGRRMSPRRKMSPEAARRMSPPGMRGQRMPSPSPQGRRMSPSGVQGRKMTSGPVEGRRMSPTGPQGRRMSPSGGVQGRRMSPTGPQGRRMSPSGPQGRRMSPTGPQGRRVSPSGPQGRMMPSIGPQGRRMSPSGPSGRRLSPTGPQGRRMTPTGPPGRRMSPTGPQGRRMSPTGLQGRRMSPSGPQGRRMSPTGPQGRRMSPTGPQGRRMSPTGPQGRRMSPTGVQGRRLSPTGPQGRRMSPTGPQGRRMSPGPPGRRISPSGAHHARRLSPTMHEGTDRRISPGRSGMRMSPSRMAGRVPRVMTPPHGRKMSPGAVGRMSPGRRMSRMSPGRRVSPPPLGAHGRRMSPGIPGRHVSPPVARRMSPGIDMPPDRRLSPAADRQRGRRSPPRRRSPRADSPPSGRDYPPSFHQAKKPKYEDDERPQLKQVRPAYEPPTKAANQAMYSGGYRPNIHDNAPYPASSGRQEPWQQTNKPTVYNPSKNLDSRIEKFDIPRVSESLRMGEGESKRSRSRNRDSRSPIRRERSPFKDRYRRHSPSPRSPRRSWALEKRRSPDIRDAPPPPVWPGQSTPDSDFHRQGRQNFPDVSEKINKKHEPSWERPVYEERDDVLRQGSGPEASRRPFSSDEHARGSKWKPISLPSPKESSGSFRSDDRFPDNDRDSQRYIPKEEFDRPSSRDRMPYSDKRDFRDYPPKKDDRDELRHKKDLVPRREGFLRDDDDRRDLLRGIPPDMNKEIEDVYKRVAELGKKAQQFRKKDSRFEDRDDQYYNRGEDPTSRGGDVRRDTSPDVRYRNDEIGRREEDARSHNSHSDEADRPARQRESRWSNPATDSIWRLRKPLPPAVKAKRDKAGEELVRRIMNRFKDDIADSQRERIQNELSLSITRIFYDMFKDEDVSYIELVIRFNKKYDSNDEAKIFEEVMSSFSSGYRKRGAQVESAAPAKTAQRSPNDLTRDVQKGYEFQNVAPYTVPEWNVNPVPPVNAVQPTPVAPPLVMPQVSYVMNPGPMMVPTPSYLQPSNLGFEPLHEPTRNGYNLFMCKDGFQPFDDHQAEQLKSFVISQMFEESDKTDGWAPDFIMKGLQSAYRYEIVTHDERSMEWLLNLDFGKFSAFNVLVYTGEELWYERAAIWLPGHSRCRHIEPLNKLKLQNKKLEGVHIGKWKFVRKVVTQMGTRIYVDIPPSSARALEKYKNMLSYELQKVSVFLKAAAVDKNAFDAGLNEPSIEYVPQTQNSPMPSLAADLNVVKIGIKGNKNTSLPMARKIKDMIVYKLYQYLQQGGTSSTDFLKYGFCAPGFLGVVPENTESRRWIVGLNIGTLNRQPVLVIGGDETNLKYIKMYVLLPPNVCTTSQCSLVLEKLKQSNQGVKGLNFSAWKNPKISFKHGGTSGKLEVHMDLESVETIAKLDYELDYVDEGHESRSVPVKSDYSLSELEKIIKNYRDEMTDTYDVANMDIESESEEDVVCLD